jgi:hypothetical protein
MKKTTPPPQKPRTFADDVAAVNEIVDRAWRLFAVPDPLPPSAANGAAHPGVTKP